VPLLSVGAQSVSVADQGSGEPILFVHAYPLNGAMWDYQVASFADRYRVVAIDLPGFGSSPAPADPSAMRIDDYADIVAGVVQQLDLAPVVLAGCSLGGYVAFAVVRRHPQLLRALVLSDTRTQSDDSAGWQRRTKTQHRIAHGTPLAELADELIPGMLARDSMQRPELVDYVRALMLASEPAGWIAALEAMKSREDSISTLEDIGVPTLVVVGEQDRLTPQTEATLIQARVKDSRLVVVPDAGHLPNIEQPVAFDEALAELLTEL
jgi:3-oxoadipate enol-lactonase